MEIKHISRHCYTDQYGYRCGVDIGSEDDEIVVFDSKPHLSFDFKKHGIRIRRSKYHDYILRYVIKNGRLFLWGIEARLSFFSRKSQIMGVSAQTNNKGKWSAFLFDGIPVDYSGTLRIGRTFDYRYWQHDDKGSPVPFSPEVYKENGTIKIENGTVTETDLHTRDQ